MKKRVILISILFFIFLSAYSRISESIGNVLDISEKNGKIFIKTSNAEVQITSYNSDIIRVRVNKNKIEKDFSYAIIASPASYLKKEFENEKSVIYYTSTLKIQINKEPFRISFYTTNNECINADDTTNGIKWIGTEVINYKKLFSDEKFIGLGEKTGGLNRRGSAYENWNSDVPGYTLNQDPLYATIPFYIGIHNRLVYGIFLDNSYKSYFNFGASTDEKMMSFGAADGELNYYFIYGENVGKIINNYTYLTGKPQLPPLWSLGYQQCRYSYYPDTELLTIAKTFRDKKIPADVLYLDIHYMDNFKIFTFNPNYYSKSAETIEQLDKMGFKTVVIVDPGIKVEDGYHAYEEGKANDFFVKYPSGEPYIGSVWPGRSCFPDFTNPKVRQWWADKIKFYADNGVAGIWNDMNEPAAWGQHIPNIVEFNFEGEPTSMSQAHNVYGMLMSRSSFEGMKKHRNNKRSLIITRATYSGGQRYSTIWTGDNASYDEHMLLGVRLVNSLGLAGFSFAGPDIGGFIGDPSRELMARWLNIGIFTPFLRNHVAYDRNYREPWLFGKEYENIYRNFINLRYQLIPYLYSAAFEASQTGMPVNRTLAINYTFDENIYKYEFENEFLFGPFFLVAPVKSTDKYCKVYLPSGNWYRLNSDLFYKGKNEYIVDAPIDNLPVFIKAGAIIPLQSVVQYTSQKGDEILYLHVYFDSNESSFAYYEDDGVSFDYEKDYFYLRNIVFNPNLKKIILEKPNGMYKSKFKKFKIILHGFSELKTLSLNKTNLQITKEKGIIYSELIDNTNDEIILEWK